MSYKTILLHLNDERRARKLIAQGAVLARTFESHLIGLHVFPSGMLTTPGPLRLPADLVGSIRRKVREESERIRATFEQVTTGQAFVSEWRNLTEERGDPAEIVAAHARTCDLVVACQPDPEWEMAPLLDFPERLAMESGRPVLVVPNGEYEPVQPRRIAVAWNGSRESARAIFDAIPLLQRAESVTVLTVDERADEETVLPDVELAAALARHAVKLSLRRVKPGRQYTGEVIRLQAMDIGADLLVLGAYGRPRLLEFVFGGVTRHIAKSAGIPVLFAH